MTGLPSRRKGPLRWTALACQGGRLYRLSRSALHAVWLTLLLLGPAVAQTLPGELLWRQKTSWGEIRVRQSGDVRRLIFADRSGETEESRMSVRQPMRPQLAYVQRMLQAAQARWPQAEQPYRFLVVGLGGASLSNALSHHFPNSTVLSLELEPAVVEAARRYFAYRDDARRQTVVTEARAWLSQNPERFDGIFLDAFDGREVPEGLRTVEFTELVSQRLHEEGAVIANIHLLPQSSSARYQQALRHVFPAHLLLPGLAQGIGVFAKVPFPESLPGDLPVLPAWDLEGIEPFRDG